MLCEPLKSDQTGTARGRFAARIRAVGDSIAVSGGFKARARLYEALDHGACARAPGFMRRQRAPIGFSGVLPRALGLGGCSVPTISLLASLGVSLAPMNIALARVVAFPGTSPEECDRRLVSIEQHAVEAFLAAARRKNPEGHTACVKEIDALLTGRWLTGRWRAVGAVDADLRRYDKVLQSLTWELNGPLSFADRVHREEIGFALIDSYREAFTSRTAAVGHRREQRTVQLAALGRPAAVCMSCSPTADSWITDPVSASNTRIRYGKFLLNSTACRSGVSNSRIGILA